MSSVIDPQVNPKISLSLNEGVSGKVCIPNISTAERRKRLAMGGVAFVAALVILAVLMVSGADRLLRLVLFPVFFMAATGYFQWRDKTCVGLVAINARVTGEKMEKVEDATELAQLRRQAVQVQLKSLAAALPLTLIVLILPVLAS